MHLSSCTLSVDGTPLLMVGVWHDGYVDVGVLGLLIVPVQKVHPIDGVEHEEKQGEEK